MGSARTLIFDRDLILLRSIHVTVNVVEILTRLLRNVLAGTGILMYDRVYITCWYVVYL